MKNYNGLFEITCSLNSVFIKRLKLTWAEVSDSLKVSEEEKKERKEKKITAKKEKERMEVLFFSSEENKRKRPKGILSF